MIHKAPALAQKRSKSAGAKEAWPCSRVSLRSRQLSMTTVTSGSVTEVSATFVAT